QNCGAAFLPASYEGTPYLTRTGKLPNIANPEMKRDEQRKQLDLIQSMNKGYLEQAKRDAELEGVIESYEMKKAYGLDNNATRDFGTQCLLARRLSEAGVRFIEVSNGGWDHHTNL